MDIQLLFSYNRTRAGKQFLTTFHMSIQSPEILYPLLSISYSDMLISPYILLYY
jgi:hypothetical protein